VDLEYVRHVSCEFMGELLEPQDWKSDSTYEELVRKAVLQDGHSRWDM
jgi:hypothetical protein